MGMRPAVSSRTRQDGGRRQTESRLATSIPPSSLSSSIQYSTVRYSSRLIVVLVSSIAFCTALPRRSSQSVSAHWQRERKGIHYTYSITRSTVTNTRERIGNDGWLRWWVGVGDREVVGEREITQANTLTLTHTRTYIHTRGT